MFPSVVTVLTVLVFILFTNFWNIVDRGVVSRVGHQRLTVIFAGLYIVLSLILIFWYFFLTRRLLSWRRSCDRFMVMDYWTPLTWRRMIRESDFCLSLLRRRSISSYYFIEVVEGVEVRRYSNLLSQGKILHSWVRCQSLEIYFLWTLGWWSLSFLSDGSLKGGWVSPNATEYVILIHESLLYDLGPYWKGV